MNRYDSYKDSGVEWIGEIPSVWKFGKMKYQLSNNDGGVWGSDVENENDGTVVIRSTEITIDGQWDLSNPMKRILTDSEIEKTLLYSGDIVLTKSSGSPNHIGKSVIVNSEVENLKCCYSNFVQRLRFRNYNSKLYHYILNNHVVREQYRYLTQTTTGLGNLNGTTLNEVFLPFIPLSEQQQIVTFLDTKTSLIDSLIEKTQRKIELLKEKRTSLINEVVTKGLNPNVEMKDSGVEWIGEIPKGWRIGKLYQYSEMSNGSTPSRDKPEYWENGTIPWMSSGEINKKKIRDIDGRITQEGFENSSTKILPIGTVMMGLNGQGKTKGTVGILEIETTCNQSLCGMIFKDDMYPMFSYYFLDSQYYHIRGLVGEGQREGISVSFLGRYPLVVPPISEQKEIIEYLDEQTELIDKTISIEEKRIELIKEYRQSLISEVVTGKRKVV